MLTNSWENPEIGKISEFTVKHLFKQKVLIRIIHKNDIQLVLPIKTS